ncbi:MAG: STAS domain-containing protein [Phycisphaerales bacterium]|nr:STAS domain-containing protein [Phycisphaerales bacterium]
MRIEQKRHGAVTVIRPLGPVSNKGDAARLANEMSELVKQTLGRFVLDASEITFIDSYGLESLVDISNELGSSGKPFRICGVCETLREVFAITEVAPKFQQYEDVQTAVRSFL